jgi:hypothetical protein
VKAARSSLRPTTPPHQRLFHLGQDPFFSLSILGFNDGRCDASFYSLQSWEREKPILYTPTKGTASRSSSFRGEPREVDLEVMPDLDSPI